MIDGNKQCGQVHARIMVLSLVSKLVQGIQPLHRYD